MGLTKVSTDGVKDDAVTSGKIPANAVGSSELAANAVDSNAIQSLAVTANKIAAGEITNTHIGTGAINADRLTDATVTLAKLEHGTSSNDGKFLRANNGADPTFETVSTDLVADTTPQLGGNLASNGNDIDFADNDKAVFGNSDDLKIFHNAGSSSEINYANGNLVIKQGTHSNAESPQFDGNGNLYIPDNNQVYFGGGSDLQIYHDGSHSYIKDNGTGNLRIQSNATIQLGDPTGSIDYAKFINGGYSEIYGNNTKRFETTSYGTKVFGYQSASSYVGFHVMGSRNNEGYGTNHGSGITTYDVTYYSPIPMFASKTIDHGSSYLSFPSYAGGNYVKFTAPVAGLYMLELIASVESHHGGDWMQMGWEINTETNNSSSNFMNNSRGVLAVNERAGDDTETGCHFSTVIYMAANDYAVLYQQSTAAVRWRGNQYYVRGHLI